MTTEITTIPSIAAPGALVTVDPAFMERLTALRQTIAPTLTDAELELFGLIAQRKGLDPFSGQIIAVKRNTNRGARVTYTTGIDGYRSIAERTEEYLGSDEPEFGPPCGCGHPQTYHPEWARVVVHRLHPSGRVIHQPGKAKWHEYVPGAGDDFMWVGKPEVMLGKCAEAQGLRRAFPWVLGDIYVPEELARAEDGNVAQPATVSAREAVAAKAAEIRGETPEGGSGAVDQATLADDAAETPDQAPEPPTDVPDDAAVTIEPLTGEQFRDRIRAAGITVEAAKEASDRLYPGRSSKSLQPDEWGRLWTAIAPE